jgi:actin-related protein
MYDGLADRLKHELLKFGASAETSVIARADSKIISWKGASTVGSMNSF